MKTQKNVNTVITDNALNQLSKNGLDFMRYYAIFCVMILHFTSYYRIYGLEPDNKLVNYARSVSLLIPGVPVFFALSGFFSFFTLSKSPNIFQYISKRLHRIYPPLWLVLVINLISLVILVPDRLINRGVMTWIVVQLFGVAYTPEAFRTYATGSINGALWTVFVQIQLFLVIGFSYSWLKKLSFQVWNVIIAVSIVLNIFSQYITGLADSGNTYVINKIIERSFIPYFYWFILGAYCYHFSSKIIPFCKKIYLFAILLLVVINVFHLPNYGYYCGWITGVLSVFITFGIGYSLPSVRLYDISYELFLCHWIFLNVIVHLELFVAYGGVTCFAMFMACSLLTAFIVKQFFPLKKYQKN